MVLGATAHVGDSFACTQGQKPYLLMLMPPEVSYLPDRLITELYQDPVKSWRQRSIKNIKLLRTRRSKLSGVR
jgi:hypothetical protein